MRVSGNQSVAPGHNEVVGNLEPTDYELWHRSVGGDGPAFGELFGRHSSEVYNHLFRRTASWSQAEDLTSIVFLEAWRKHKEVRIYSESILPWLLSVANNVLRNSERSLRRHNRLLAKLQSQSTTVNFSDEMDARIDDEQTMSKILSKLSSLRIEEREVISLCDWAGLTYAEVAHALDIPVGTVRSRLSRARAHLRERFPAASTPHDLDIHLATKVHNSKES